jgi:hypothetical protein
MKKLFFNLRVLLFAALFVVSACKQGESILTFKY